MRRIHNLVAATLLVFSQSAQAQHEHHAPEDSSETHEVPMSHGFSKNLPMNRNGSGTGWLPDAAPMYGYMYHSKKWMYMFHGNIFLRYNNQDVAKEGSRGGA